MTGLEKIIYKIEEDSKSVCAEIIGSANKEAAKIINDAQKEATEKTTEIISVAQREADRIISVAKSSAETITRTKYLEIRSAVVYDIISAAYEQIEKSDAKTYFDLLFRLCLKNFETGECVMFLNQNDLNRMPSDFEDRINGEVYQKGAVQVSKQSKDIENGFILDYGDFEINCTLRAVFDEKMDELTDLLSSHLFKENN